MDAVTATIPQEVLDHIRGLAQQENSLEGKFTTPQVAEGLGCGEAKARDIIRDLMRTRRIRCRRVNLTDEEAWEAGYLAGTSVICYEWIERGVDEAA